MNNELNELKPCPFCGGKAEEDTHIGGVICENYCTNPNTFDGGGGVWTADWNTRPIEDALNARIVELEVYIERLIRAGNALDVPPDDFSEEQKDWRETISEWLQGEI